MRFSIAEKLHLAGQLVDAPIFGRDARDNGGPPAGTSRHEFENRLDLLLEATSALAVGLIQHKDVGNLHQAGLQALHLVTHARHKNDDCAVS